jgi:hypothetical protein
MKNLAFCLCWVLICATPGVMAQQTATPNQSWDVLRQLRAGQKLKVDRKKRSQGSLSACPTRCWPRPGGEWQPHVDLFRAVITTEATISN